MFPKSFLKTDKSWIGYSALIKFWPVGQIVGLSNV